jgi:hypothetical protein
MREAATPRLEAAWLPCRESPRKRRVFPMPLAFLTSLRCAGWVGGDK